VVLDETLTYKSQVRVVVVPCGAITQSFGPRQFGSTRTHKKSAEANDQEKAKMPKFDITKGNVAVDKLLESTENPRHRFLLMSYGRHRFLEVAGRYEEIFAPDMMSMDPVYHFHYGGNDVAVRGQDHVKSLYRMWAETNQSIFYMETEEIAVADHFIASVGISYQQVSGKSLRANKALSHLPDVISHKLLEKFLDQKEHKADENDMYLYKFVEEMVWPYDDRCRLIGEDVWEPDPSKGELFKLDPADVLTMQESAKLLAPLIKPLPSFDEYVLGKRQAAGR
jgi:hypothetical protein